MHKRLIIIALNVYNKQKHLRANTGADPLFVLIHVKLIAWNMDIYCYNYTVCPNFHRA